jgi:chaperonin cofactor prefoldin
MDKAFIEKQINQANQTIGNLEKYAGNKETFSQKILMDAKSFLKELEKMNEKFQ